MDKTTPKSPLSLPLPRLLSYCGALFLAAIIFVTLHYSKKKQEWDRLKEQIGLLQQLSAQCVRKQALNGAVRHLFAKTDPLYLENQLESLNFLRKEKEALEQLLNNPAFTGNEAAEKRYSFLLSNANRFEWLQGSTQMGEGFQQTEIYLAHPLEIDGSDLKEILSRIEGSRKGKPQMVITDFKLHKKELPSGNEVFDFNMKFLKRDFNL